MSNILQQVPAAQFRAHMNIQTGAAFIGDIPSGEYTAFGIRPTLNKDGSVKYYWVGIVSTNSTKSKYFIPGEQALTANLVKEEGGVVKLTTAKRIVSRTETSGLSIVKADAPKQIQEEQE